MSDSLRIVHQSNWPALTRASGDERLSLRWAAGGTRECVEGTLLYRSREPPPRVPTSLLILEVGPLAFHLRQGRQGAANRGAAAVDHVLRPVDVAGEAGAQEQHDVGNLLGRAVAPETQRRMIAVAYDSRVRRLDLRL